MSLAKEHLRVQHDLEDGLISSYLNSAISFAQDYTGLQFEEIDIIDEIVDPVGEYQLNKSIATSITSFTGSVDDTVFESVPYELSNDGGVSIICFEVGDYSSFKVTYKAGANIVNGSIKQAILFMLAHFYENRNAVGVVETFELPLSVQYLLNPYRVVFFG